METLSLLSFLSWKVGRAVICPPKMHHRHALYDSRRVTDRLQQCTASLATHAVLGSLYESYRDFVAYRNQYRESAGIEMPHRNLLLMERTYISLSLSV